MAFAPTLAVVLPSLFGERAARRVHKLSGVLVFSLWMWLPSTSDRGDYGRHGWFDLSSLEVFLLPHRFGQQLNLGWSGGLWLALWVFGGYFCWKRARMLLVISLLVLVGWNLLPLEIPRPGGLLGARYFVPWFLISSLVVAVGLRAVADRVGVVLTLIALLLVISPLPNRGHRAEVGESVEWGMLLPIAAIRLPATAIPEPSADPYWSFIAGIHQGWSHNAGASSTQVVERSLGWAPEFWAGVGLTEASLQPDSPASARQLCLGLEVQLLNKRADPAQCLPELHDVLRQRKVVTENAFYRGMQHRRHQLSTSNDPAFRLGYEHPVSSVRRPLPRFAPANAFAP